MKVRPAVALSLVLALVHVNIARAELVCPGESGRGHVQHGEQQPSGQLDGQEHSGHDGGSTSGSDSESCEAPAPVQCCGALASCSGTADAVRGDERAPVLLEVAELPPGLADAPATSVAPPEPPPPRA